MVLVKKDDKLFVRQFEQLIDIEPNCRRIIWCLIDWDLLFIYLLFIYYALRIESASYHLFQLMVIWVDARVRLGNLGVCSCFLSDNRMRRQRWLILLRLFWVFLKQVFLLYVFFGHIFTIFNLKWADSAFRFKIDEIWFSLDHVLEAIIIYVRLLEFIFFGLDLFIYAIYHWLWLIKL